jgi:hypothetical protein
MEPISPTGIEEGKTGRRKIREGNKIRGLARSSF